MKPTESTASTSASTSASHDRIGWCLLIFVFAIAIRLAAMWPLMDSALFDTIMGDAINYDSWARRIAGGDWIGEEVFYQAPLYPYFLGTLYWIVGDDLLVVRWVQIILGAASCVLIALAGWRWLSKPVGILAGAMLAVYAPAIFADLSIQKSVLDVFFVCLTLFILSGMDARPSAARCLGLGLTIGALVLSRENALVFVAVLFPWLLARGATPRRERLSRALLFACGVALVLTPVALRNWHVGGELHLTTSQFGHNFFIGNNETADGRYRPLIAHRADPRIERQDAIEIAERASGRSLTSAEVSAFYSERAVAYILSQPGDWVALLGRKLALAFNAVELVDSKDQYSYGALSPVLRATDFVLHFGVLAPLALLGVLVSGSDRRRLLPLYLLFVSYTATLLVFYIFGRYRLPTVPILILLAAAGIVRGRGTFASSTKLQIAYSAAAIGAVIVFCNWPISQKTYMRSVTQYNLANELAARERLDEAMNHYREAIRLHDGNAPANHNLGSLLASAGELDAALVHFDRAIEIDADYAQAHWNRARALKSRGGLEAALESFERGLAVDPNRADVHVEAGQVCEALGLLSRAAFHFERALLVDSGNLAASQGLLRVRDRRAAQRR